MDRPPPDPTKLLTAWMEWERGENPPGRTMATLKTGGLRDLLEEMVTAATPAPSAAPAAGGDDPGDGGASTESWTPVV